MNCEEKESKNVDRAIPNDEIRDVVRFAKDSILKLLAKIPTFVKRTASVRMMERSLMVRDVSPK